MPLQKPLRLVLCLLLTAEPAQRLDARGATFQAQLAAREAPLMLGESGERCAGLAIAQRLLRLLEQLRFFGERRKYGGPRA
jgi:hypothetical protein